MEDYRKQIIEFVRDRPLLWDPLHPDYHNKHQRKQVWEDIDNKCPSTGTNTTSKTIWESLTKSFSNALRRTNNKPPGSGSEAGTEKQWKYMKDMLFLLPAKATRKSSSNVVVPDFDMTSSDYVDNEEEGPITIPSQSDAVDSQLNFLYPSSEDDTKFVRLQECSKKRKVAQNSDRDSDITATTNAILEMMKQRQLDRSKESPRLNFFRSILPSIDSLEEEQFISFQIEVLQALQRQTRVNSHSLKTEAC